LVNFAVGGAAVTAQDWRPARATFAEMIAFARIASVACQRLAPDADSFHALALRGLIKPPITEETTGFRVIARKDGTKFRLYSRPGNDPRHTTSRQSSMTCRRSIEVRKTTLATCCYLHDRAFIFR
jgi:hypothetical protein